MRCSLSSRSWPLSTLLLFFLKSPEDQHVLLVSVFPRGAALPLPPCVGAVVLLPELLQQTRGWAPGPRGDTAGGRAPAFWGCCRSPCDRHPLSRSQPGGGVGFHTVYFALLLVFGGRLNWHRSKNTFPYAFFFISYFFIFILFPYAFPAHALCPSCRPLWIAFLPESRHRSGAGPS